VGRFGVVAAELLRLSPAYRARVEAVTPDGRRIRAEPGADADADTHSYVLATLVSNLERTFTMSPATRPLDGRLRLVRFGAVPGERAMDILMAAYRDGAHVEEPEVGYDEVARIEVTMHDESPRWRKVCVDGTIVEVPVGGEVVVERGGASAFDVLVGAGVLGEGRGRE
jgi:hypothetical protein